MRELFEVFESYLNEEEGSNGLRSDDGMTTLYHYTQDLGDSVVLDPEFAKDRRGNYSRREFETAQTPRLFFYLDPKERESHFFSGTLYKAEVPTSEIYNFSADEEDILGQVRHPIYGMRKGEEWNKVFEGIRDGVTTDSEGNDIIMSRPRDGLYYKTPRFRVVTWMKPLEVFKVDKEEKERLERHRR
jgi:hypothetical protein